MPTSTSTSPNWTSPSASGNSRTRTWVNTPNLKSLHEWEKPINSYTDFNTVAAGSTWWPGTKEVRNSDGYTTYAYTAQYPESPKGAYDRHSVRYVARVSPLSAKLTAMRNRTIVKCLGKASDAKLNLAVTVAEAGKTASMILQAAKRIDGAYRAFRRGNFKRVASLLNLKSGTVHKTWLEYKYGWTPLLYDVKNAAEFFAQEYVGRPAHFIVDASELDDQYIDTSWNEAYVPYGGGATADDAYRLRVSVKVRYKLWLELTYPNYAKLQQLGITNPALIAWELVPFSFVFDWFISVGDYLKALTALNGLTIKKGMTSTVVVVDANMSRPTTSRVSGGWTYTNNAWGDSWSYREYSRQPWSPSLLDLYPPKNSSSFGFQKMITSLALVRAGHRGDKLPLSSR